VNNDDFDKNGYRAVMSAVFLRTTDLCRFYKTPNSEIRALDSINLSVEAGDFLAIVGSSGSGKSTLLSIMAGLHKPTSGSVEFEGRSLYSLSRKELAGYRAHRAGMIFQSFNLIPHYSALKNVEMAMLFSGERHRERQRKAIEALERLGLKDRMHHRPGDLSGGEQQRTAIARAIVKNPSLIFADEPTGNLDYENARQIMELLADLNRNNVTIILVTHNLELGQQYARVVKRLHYGEFVATGDNARGSGR
jgi:putative ABC transport system ATP-binding protein